jgi:UDP-N-acetylglucosamine--N-acetylmuramyl-(pentapeptide) pyrophosphoryl-undecaprenol N-acetylglucosamine transferase
VFVSFEYSKKFFPKEKVVKTGLPVRRSLIDGLKLSKEQARVSLNLSDKPTLLVMGGSQGAVFLNNLAYEIFKRTDFQGVHITGERDYERFKDAYKNMPVLVLPFTENMGLIYRACDLALSRAGASTITELSLYGVPALFVPFPHAIRDHQYYNAKEIEGLGGGLVIRQEEAELNTVLKLLEKILSNREEFSKAIAYFAEQNPCEKILNSLQEFLPRY